MDTDLLEAPEIKAIGNTTINIDEAKGIIEAFVAAVGNKDSVDDIIIPGAFTSSLLRRKPRVVWGHNWNEPIGKVLEITEVPPTDSRLPQKMKDAGVGGLYAKVQFNLASERGREAFATVLFFGEEQEWSIGYKTIRKDYDPIRKANILHEVELYEVSPVLHGANNLTGTISVKSEPGHDIELTYTSNEETDDDEKSIHGTYDFEDEKGEAKMQRLLRDAITGVFGNTTKINFMDNHQIVFLRPDGTMWMTTYRVNYPRVMFSPPQRARMRTIVEPLPVGNPAMERASYHDDDDEVSSHNRRKDDPEVVDNDINVSSSGNNIRVWNNTVTGTTSGSTTDWTYVTDGSMQFTKGWEWEKTDEEDEENEQEKAGHVLNKRNMKRLEEALQVIEEVLQTGILDEDGEEEAPVDDAKVVGGVLFKAYKAKSADSENDFVVGRPETLNGTSIGIPVEDREKADEVLLALEDSIVALDLAVVAPGEQSFEKGPSTVSVYLSSNEGLTDQIQALAEALSQVKGDFNLSVERTEPQSFSEVFTAGKV